MIYLRAIMVAAGLFALYTAHSMGVKHEAARNAASVAALNAELDAVTDDAANAEAARLAAERARDELMEALDAQAVNDPMANGDGLSPSSLRRLDAIR